MEQLNLYFKAFGTPAEKIWPNINWGKFEKYQRKTIQEIVDNQHIDEQAVNLLEVTIIICRECSSSTLRKESLPLKP